MVSQHVDGSEQGLGVEVVAPGEVPLCECLGEVVGADGAVWAVAVGEGRMVTGRWW